MQEALVFSRRAKNAALEQEIQQAIQLSRQLPADSSVVSDTASMLHALSPLSH